MDEEKPRRSPAKGSRERTIVEADGGWYFRTREQIDVGPFPSHEAAWRAARELTRLLASQTSNQAAHSVVAEFLARHLRQ